MRVARIIFVLICLLFFQSVPGYAAPDYSKTPVFFVHGHSLNASNWATMISYLTDAGYPAEYLEAIQLVPNTGANIPAAEEQIAPAIETFLDSINTFLAANYPDIPLKTKVDIVSHSMGSLSSRWYAARVRPDRVHKWISLAGANHGTNDLCSFPDPGADDSCPAYAENEQESFIQYQLNGAPYVADVDETPYGIGQDSSGVVSVPPDQNRRIFYLIIRTDPDEWIDPIESPILDGAGGATIPIPGDLPATMTLEGNFLMTNGVGHDAMLSDPETMRLVKIFLDYALNRLDDLAVDFGTSGVYTYDGISWDRINKLDPAILGVFESKLVASFPSKGLYEYDSSGWKRITTNDSAEDTTGVGSTLYVDFGTSGLYSFDGLTWKRITTSDCEDMVTADVR